MRLNANQLAARVGRVAQLLIGLHPLDAAAVLERSASASGVEGAQVPVATEAAIPDKIVSAIHTGLDRADAQMVRAAMEYETTLSGREYLKELSVEITDYRIADASLARIVEECDEVTLSEIEGALKRRKAAPAKASSG